ncbi:glycosyltransferase family 8 protein [Latilactobacillus curvatus]|uniref:glycosyltransferase family 8 protein n=1 Tax=Latilactobacillus curvatus TaxID=28038 RepID=UPI0020C7D2DB|nr:glycosyltransferase family 8 protein [Latilactobacillus curvatus]MCP8861635.1 glycosyltransferase family 8 protein [Latilactobacillus curvatus]MCP8868592.1 glycosyltransferase family 8 protein [Latilactobacillus curvatus]MCP8872135.1 glycosyltransferase family 8 protein [Latilactobacillus curvatus]MCP8881159.1 glycosyltransferase family 8 protein [Latilactobacillus curvatus]
MVIINAINIIFAADENYGDQLLIAIKSVLTHISPKTTINFFILDNELTPQTKHAVSKRVPRPNQVEFIALNKQLFENCPESNHINKTAYYRILAPTLLLRKKIERVLYLDVDILVQTDLTPLYNTPLGTNIVGAVIDPGQALTLRRLGITPPQSNNIYFNSGVMLIDTVRWNHASITERTFHFINHHADRLQFHDQDALNATLVGKVKLLHPKWNVQNSLLFRKHAPINTEYAHLFDEAIANPAIVHFTTHEKPWNTLKSHPFLNQYQKELKQLHAQQSDIINIVSAVNSDFIETLAILYASILNHNDSHRHYAFYVLEDHLTARDKAVLQHVVARFDADLTFAEVNESLLANTVESDRILKTAYYRILIPDVFPHLDRALYIDCDALCLTDLARLWDIDLGQSFLAAVEDAGFHERLEKMAIDYQSPRYFNSGVMLLNLKKWRQHNIVSRVLDFINQHPEKLRFHDQDALNAILHDRWIHLHPMWNAQTNILMNTITPPTEHLKKQFLETQKEPALVHFCGHEKPWHASSSHPFTPQYRYYRQRFLKQKKRLVPFANRRSLSQQG